MATETTSLPELLEKLRDISEPPAISMAPQTPAWMVVGIIVVGLVLAAAWLLWRRHQSNRYRRAALAELKRLQTSKQLTPEAVSELLRRTALATYPRAKVAGLTGSDWPDFLAKTAPGARLTMPDLLFAPSIYGAKTALSPEQSAELDRFARHWIGRHHA